MSKIFSFNAIFRSDPCRKSVVPLNRGIVEADPVCDVQTQ